MEYITSGNTPYSKPKGDTFFMKKNVLKVPKVWKGCTVFLWFRVWYVIARYVRHVLYI